MPASTRHILTQEAAGAPWPLKPNNKNTRAPKIPHANSYVDSPYLVGGKKFDLRIYALVTSYAPLRIYLYRRAQ